MVKESEKRSSVKFTSRGMSNNFETPPRSAKSISRHSKSLSAPLISSRFLNDDANENIRVCVRFRPCKQGQDENDDIDILSDSVIVKESKKQFVLDRVFNSESTQEEIFSWAMKNQLEETLHGINVTILAYGQTGAGKTHTMFGSSASDEPGIIPRCCSMLFDLMEEDEQGQEFTCSCSMLEIYQEELRDLISPEKGTHLEIHETRDGNVTIDGLSKEYVTNASQVMDIIEMGNGAKAVASTSMNAESSRSHTIVSLDIVMKDISGTTKKGRLNLVDLAGSEKIKKTGAVGQTLEEAKKINLSLTALSHCIYSLTKNESHIPFRSSKLTRFLQNSLGGNSKTTLVVACASELSNKEETISSLEFATRAKKIKNKVVVNSELSAEILKDKLRTVEFELSALQQYISELESTLKKNGIRLPPKDPSLQGPSSEEFRLTDAQKTFRSTVSSPQTNLSNQKKDDENNTGKINENNNNNVGNISNNSNNIDDDEISHSHNKKRPSAIEQAKLLASTPDLGGLDEDDLAEEIVHYKAEIQALHSEIESIYSLVLSHEDEIAKFLETKNLEVSTLRLQLQQYGGQNNDQNSFDPEEVQVPTNGVLGNTKSGKELMTLSTFVDAQNKISSGESVVDGAEIKSPAFTNLQYKIAEQTQALDFQQGVLVKQQDVLVLQQAKIRELEMLLARSEMEKEEAIKAKEELQQQNNQTILKLAQLRRVTRENSLNSKEKVPSHLSSDQRTKSDSERFPPSKIIKPLIPKARAKAESLIASMLSSESTLTDS